MNDDPQIIVEANRDSLSDSPYVANDLSFRFVDWRIDRAYDEWIANPNLVELSTLHVRRDRLDIDGYIGELRQELLVAGAEG